MSDHLAFAEEIRATITFKARRIIDEAVRNNDISSLRDDLNEMTGIYARKLRQKGIEPTTDTAWCEAVNAIMDSIPDDQPSTSTAVSSSPVSAPMKSPQTSTPSPAGSVPAGPIMMTSISSEQTDHDEQESDVTDTVAMINKVGVWVFTSFNSYRGDNPSADPITLTTFAKKTLLMAEAQLTKNGLPVNDPAWVEHKERLISTCKGLEEQHEAKRRAQAQAEIEAEIKRKADDAVRRAVDELESAVDAVLGSDVENHDTLVEALEDQIMSIQDRLARLDVMADHQDWVNATKKARETVLERTATSEQPQRPSSSNRSKFFYGIFADLPACAVDHPALRRKTGTVGDMKVMLASAAVVGVGVITMIALIKF